MTNILSARFLEDKSHSEYDVRTGRLLVAKGLGDLSVLNATLVNFQDFLGTLDSDLLQVLAEHATIFSFT